MGDPCLGSCKSECQAGASETGDDDRRALIVLNLILNLSLMATLH